VAKGHRHFDASRLFGSSKFKVGQVVVVAKRMMAGVNKPGGAAFVASVAFVDGAPVYDVKYVLSSSSEKALPEGLLSIQEAAPSRAHASSVSRRAADDQRTLVDENKRLHDENENLKWQSKRDRAAVATLKKDVKETTRVLLAASKARGAAVAEGERAKVQAEFNLKAANDSYGRDRQGCDWR